MMAADVQIRHRAGLLRCHTCGKWKDVSKFPVDDRMKSRMGRSQDCKPCTTKKARVLED